MSIVAHGAVCGAQERALERPDNGRTPLMRNFKKGSALVKDFPEWNYVTRHPQKGKPGQGNGLNYNAGLLLGFKHPTSLNPLAFSSYRQTETNL